jgi:isoleucyl-tRNA synthetase
MAEIDRWALMRLQKVVERVLTGYGDYEYHVVYHAIHNFCTVDMSALYLDIIKDRLYTASPGSRERRAAQTVMYEVLGALVRLLAPVLAFTSEEIWRYIPDSGDKPASVQLSDMPEVKGEYIDPDLEKKWDRLLDLRAVVTRALENARRDKVIGNSLEAVTELYASEDVYDFLASFGSDLATLFIVSAVTLKKEDPPAGAVGDGEIPGFGVLVGRAPGSKCERCWNYHEAVGGDAQHPTLCPRCVAVVRA